MVDTETPGVVELTDPRDGVYRIERRVQPPEVFESKMFPRLRIELVGLLVA